MSGSDEVQVSFPALRAGSEAFLTHHAKLVSTLEQLEQDLAPMLSHWSGDARDAYHRFQADWRSTADDMTGFLHQIQQTVEGSGQRYGRTEDGNVQRWSR